MFRLTRCRPSPRWRSFWIWRVGSCVFLSFPPFSFRILASQSLLAVFQSWRPTVCRKWTYWAVCTPSYSSVCCFACLFSSGFFLIPFCLLARVCFSFDIPLTIYQQCQLATATAASISSATARFAPALFITPTTQSGTRISPCKGAVCFRLSFHRIDRSLSTKKER